MKLQKLTIHNIASIEDAVIDFEAQPLVNSEVFLITGKTGAGKSTILDAICLALFSNTPRLAGTSMQGDTKDGDKSITIKDPRQLMRRNTGEAYVSLSFIGNNDVHYEALWSVARARKNVTGNIQPKVWQLKNLDTNFTLSKDKEVEAEIHNAIGLDFNQFCRTTMLAQGEFTRFLNSKDDDKAEILEKITGVTIYSKIGANVFAITSSKEQAWKSAKQIAEGICTLSDAEITEKKQALFDLDNLCNNVKAESDKDAVKLDWLKRDLELTGSKDKADQALNMARLLAQSDDFKQREQIVKDWNETIDARHYLTEIIKAEEGKEKQQKKLDELAETFSEILVEQKYAENNADNLEAEIKNIEAFILSEADKVSMYDNEQTIVSLLNSIIEDVNAIEKCQASIEAENKKLTGELMPAFEKAKDDAQNAKEAFDKVESEVEKRTESISLLKLPDLHSKREQAKDLLGKIATAKERIETLCAVKNSHEGNRKKLVERKSILDEKAIKLSKIDAPLHDVKIKMEVRGEDLEKQRNTVDKFAKALRSNLKVGDICPVCCQEVKATFPHEEELLALFDDLKKAYDETEKEYNDLVNEKVKLDAEIKAETKAYERDFNAWYEDQTIAISEQKTLDALGACGIENLSNDTLNSLSLLNENTIKTFNELEEVIKDGEKQVIEINNLRKVLEVNRKTHEGFVKNLLLTEKAISECNSRISTAEALVTSKENEICDAEKKLSVLTDSQFTIHNSQLNIASLHIGNYALSLQSAASMYRSKVQQKQNLTAKLEMARTSIENVRNVILSILSVMPAWAGLTNAQLKIADVQTRHIHDYALTLQSSVATTLSQLKSAEESLSVNQKKLDNFIVEHPELDITRLKALNIYSYDFISNESNSLNAIREDINLKKSLLEKVENLITLHRRIKPEFTEEDTFDALTHRIEGTMKRLAEIGEKKGAINQELKIDNENRLRLGAVIEDADKKKAEYQKWARLNSLIGDSTGKKFRMIAQSYVLSSLIHSANFYMRTLTDRYTLRVTPGTFVITVEDAYQGFVSRAASTISGGESFLVSLSLALALSDIGQRLSVDTLFIDEGFGTLSGEPLQNAINTLRSLHTKAGRRVGIISHVDELKERISVQIQVNREGNNSSSEVVIN